MEDEPDDLRRCRGGSLVVLADVGVGFVEELLVGVQFVFEERAAEFLLNESLALRGALPVGEADLFHDVVNVGHDALDGLAASARAAGALGAKLSGAGLGGAVFLRAGSLAMYQCSFTDNHAVAGSGDDTGTSLQALAQGKGGAVFIFAYDTAHKAPLYLDLLKAQSWSSNTAPDQVESSTYDNDDYYIAQEDFPAVEPIMQKRIWERFSAGTGPVFLTYRDEPAVNALVAKLVQTPPRHDFTAPDGIRHTVWRIPGGAEWVAAFGRVPCLYIADGHHRAASAARVARLRRSRHPRHTGAEDYNWFLCVIFPAGELKILPYNRHVLDLHGATPAAFLAQVKVTFGLAANAAPSPTAGGRVSMYLGGKWYGLRCPVDSQADPVSRLDVSVLQDKLLAPLLGIDDPRTSKRIDFVGGIRGPGELVKRVDAHGGVAFSMYPTTVAQLMAIADAGQIMPPKSTWFEPKLRSGLFVHTF